MAIRNGIYHLVGGNGDSRLVTVKGSVIDPYDHGGEVIGRLEILSGSEGDNEGRTFSLSLTDSRPTLDATHIHHAGVSYQYRLIQA